jgi:4-hydroxybenzoate polyprenyltransferase
MNAWASVWDLDHTLVSTDTFAEQLVGVVRRQPWLFFVIPFWFLRGRGFCKGRVASLAATPAESWPICAEVLDRIHADRLKGRTVVLATAAHYDVAHPIATRLGCFDVILASSDHTNLKSFRKTSEISRLAIERGWGGYSYAGDCEADLPCWRDADEIVVVNPTPALLARLQGFGKPVDVLGAARSPWRAVFRACRMHQWAKNLLLFVPAILAHQVDGKTAGLLLYAFAAFSLCASGVYLLNDITDIAADRQHPKKMARPFASGQLSIVAGLQLAACLLTIGVLISAFFLPPQFLALMAIYIVATLAYSGWLKQFPVIDVLALACMYALRLEAGAVASSVKLSDWLLTFSLFFFTSLALAKRYTELRRLKDLGQDLAAGRGYETRDIPLLESLGAASGYIAVLVLALYMNSAQMRTLYSESRVLWLICPLVLFWVTRLWMLASRGLLDDDPVVFALRDRVSLAIGVACAAVLLLASLASPGVP